MTDLENHIKAINDKTRAWVAEDPENRGAGLLVEDAAFWASGGITTVEQWELSQAKQAYSDVYKEINNFRPRWTNFDGLTADDINAMTDELLEIERKAQEWRDYDDIADAEAAAAAVATQGPSSSLTHNPFAILQSLVK